MRTFKQLLILISIIALAACGHKGPVRPLEVPLPSGVQAPELHQQGDSILLSWQLPTRNLDGSPLEQPPAVDIYRMTYDPQDECPECFDRSTLLFSIDPQLPAPARKVGERFLLFDQNLQPGTGYQYKLIARTPDGEQSRPVILRQTFITPIDPPQQVIATPHDRSVTLRWLPPALPEGAQLLGYLVYRQQDDAFSPYPITKQPLTGTEFEDFSLSNGTSYQYRIRALVKQNQQQLEGLASPQVLVTPQAGI